MNTNLAMPEALTQLLQHRTTWNTETLRTQHCQLNPKWPQGAPKYPLGSEKGQPLGFWVLQSTFTKLVL